MKFKHILLIALVLALLAFGQAGCRRDKGPDVSTLGVTVVQIQGAPPSEVSKGQQFPIMISLENKGSHDVKAGEAKVFLGGFLPNLFSLSETDLKKENVGELKKANSAAGIAGGRERVVFSENAKYVGQNVGYTQSLSYRTCFIYETNVRANMCFALQSGTCVLEEDKLEGATIGDAPIHITSITEERSGSNVQIKFKIENKGRGKVYFPDVNCERPEPFKENSVLVDMQTEEPLDCKPTLTTAKTGEGRVNSIISCKRNMQGTSDHESPVNFKLRYAYVETVDAKLGVTE